MQIAASRKRFVGEITKVTKAEDRVMGTAAISMYSAEHGAQMVRVHDVKATKQVLDMYYGIVHPFDVFCINRGRGTQLVSKRDYFTLLLDSKIIFIGIRWIL